MPVTPYQTVPPPERYRGVVPSAGSVGFTYGGLTSAMRYTDQLANLAIPEDPEAQDAHSKAYVQQIHVASVIYREADHVHNPPPLPLPDLIQAIMQQTTPGLQAAFALTLQQQFEAQATAFKVIIEERFTQHTEASNATLDRRLGQHSDVFSATLNDTLDRRLGKHSDVFNSTLNDTLDRRLEQHSDSFKAILTDTLDRRLQQHSESFDGTLKNTLDRRFETHAQVLNARFQEQTADFTGVIDQRFEQHFEQLEARFDEVAQNLTNVREHLDDRLDTLEKNQIEIDLRTSNAVAETEEKIEQFRKEMDDLNRRFNEGVPEQVNEQFRELSRNVRQARDELRALNPRLADIEGSIADIRDGRLRDIADRLSSIDVTQRLIINGSRPSGGWLEIPNAAGQYPTQLPELLPRIETHEAMGALRDLHLHRYVSFYDLQEANQVAQPTDVQPLTSENRERLLLALRSYLTQPRV